MWLLVLAVDVLPDALEDVFPHYFKQEMVMFNKDRSKVQSGKHAKTFANETIEGQVRTLLGTIVDNYIGQFIIMASI